MKKILVSEELADEGIQILRDHGYEVHMEPTISHEELIAAIPAYDALIVRSATSVDANVIAAGTSLKVIGRAGVGIDNIDVAAATERGIVVCNAPTSNIVSAAEQAMALMLSAARNTAAADHSMKEHIWDRGRFVGRELYEKTLAIIGLGRIGGLVAERARAFGMKLVAYDPYCTTSRAESLGVALSDSLEGAIRNADFITVHVPKNERTTGMFGSEQFKTMKDGAIVVNASRGGIFNLEALAAALSSGKVAACGIDAWEDEPCLDSPVHGFDQATLTPHLGASTFEAQTRAATQIAQYVSAGLEGSIVPTAVNMTPIPPDVLNVVGPYVPACKTMGSMLAQINGQVPKRLRISASGTLVGRDLSILIAGALDGALEGADAGNVTPVNAEAVAHRFGIQVQTSYAKEAGEYASTVAIRTDDACMACTIAEGDRAPRIVNLLGYKIDIMPQAHSLVFEYVDAPGRIGVIGTILGEAGINITTMQIGTLVQKREALVYMNVEEKVPDSVLQKLNDAIELKNLWYIRL